MKASPFDKGAMQLLQNPFDKGWSITFLALNPVSKGWLFHWPHSFVKSWGIATATSPFVKGWKATGSGSCCIPLVQQKLVGSLPEMPMPCCVLVVPGVQGIGVWVALFHTLFDDLWAVIKNVWDWVLLAVGCFSFWAALFPGESHLLKELEQILILQFLQGLFSPFLATVGQQDEVVTLLLQQLQSISVLPVHSFIVTFWQGIVPVYGNPLAGLLFGDPPAPITHPFVGIGLGVASFWQGCFFLLGFGLGELGGVKEILWDLFCSSTCCLLLGPNTFCCSFWQGAACSFCSFWQGAAFSSTFSFCSFWQGAASSTFSFCSFWQGAASSTLVFCSFWQGADATSTHVFSAPFGKVQTPLLAEAAAAPFGKVQLPHCCCWLQPH